MIVAAKPIPIDVPVVERAFQLARSGEFERIRDITKRLDSEGYVDAQEHLLDCPLLRSQLRAILRTRQAKKTAPAANVMAMVGPEGFEPPT